MKKGAIYILLAVMTMAVLFTFSQYNGEIPYVAAENINQLSVEKQGIGNMFRVNPSVKPTIEADGQAYQEVTIDVATAAVKFDDKDRIVDLQIDVTQTKMFLDQQGIVIPTDTVMAMREEAALKEIEERIKVGEVNTCGINWGHAGDVTDYDIVNNRELKSQIETIEQWATGRAISELKFDVNTLTAKLEAAEGFSITADDYWQAIYRAYQRAQ